MTEYFLPLQVTADDLFACSIPDRKPHVTIKLPIGANKPNTDKPSRPRWFSLDENNIIEKIKDTPRILCWVLEVKNIEERILALEEKERENEEH